MMRRLMMGMALALPVIVSFLLHVPSGPPPLGDWGFKFSDIVGTLLELKGKGLAGCRLPYLDYGFEYPPLVGLLWAASTCLSGWNVDLHYYIQAAALAGAYAAYLWSLSKLVPRRRLWLLLASPSLYLYSVYNWDLLAGALMLAGMVNVRRRPLLAGLLHGLAVNADFAAVAVPYYYGVKLWRQGEWRRYIIGAALGAGVPLAVLYLAAPGGFWWMAAHHLDWCEDCIYMAALREVYSPIYKWAFLAVAVAAAALFPLLGRSIEERHALLGAILVAAALGFAFPPQMFLLVLPLGLMALSRAGLAMLWAADLANFGILATWFYTQNPYTAGPPQTFAFYRDLLLVLILAAIAARAEWGKLARSIAKFALNRVPWLYIGLAAAIAGLLYIAFTVAALPGSDGLPNGPGYISDEVWYVSAARNVLDDVFHASAASPYYTVNAICLAPGLPTVKVYEKTPGYYTVMGVPPCYTRRGFPYPDKDGILDYYNLEHPPLVKYILAAVEALDDEPLMWRIPSMAMGVGAMALVYAAAKRLAGKFWALIAAALMLLDETFRSMAGIAMLDIYLAFFTALVAYFQISKRYLAAGAALGLATSVKYSGAFPIFGLAYLFIRRRKFCHLLAAAVMAAAFPLALSVPLILHFGVVGWVSATATGMQWQLTSKPPGPVPSTPLDWPLMQNSFAFYYNPDVYAAGSPLYLLALLYALYKRDDASVLLLSTYGGYWLVYLMGNHTLYSYYTAQFSPLVHVVLAPALASLWRAAKRGLQLDLRAARGRT